LVMVSSRLSSVRETCRSVGLFCRGGHSIGHFSFSR
jgi:hypothetical protein